MSIFYSASQGGFYHSAIHDTMPADVIEITDEQHAAFLDGQSQNGRLEHDADGVPLMVVTAPGLADVQAQLCDTIHRTAEAIYTAWGVDSPGAAAEYAQAHPAAWEKLVADVGAARVAGKAKVMAAKSVKAAHTAADAAVTVLQAIPLPA